MALSSQTLSTSISAEIARVSKRRETELAVARAAGAVGEARTSLYMIDQAMHFAVKARDGGETAAMAMALRALRDIR